MFVNYTLNASDFHPAETVATLQAGRPEPELANALVVFDVDKGGLREGEARGRELGREEGAREGRELAREAIATACELTPVPGRDRGPLFSMA